MRILTLSLALVVLGTAPVWQVHGQEAASRQPVPTQEAIARQFASRLTKFQDLTWEQWASQLPRRERQIDRPDLDPVNADFFGSVKTELNLNQEDVEKLKEHGVVLIDPRRDQSFPPAYYNLYTRDLPMLITTDSILHAFHHSYDKILLELESDFIRTRLALVLGDAHAALVTVAGENPEAELLGTYRDVDLYLTVARALLEDSAASRAVGQSVINQNAAAQPIVQCIHSAASTGVKRVMIYGGERPIDFTQFTVRGHYTRSPLLSNYFRCMMWLGRADCGWHILPTDTTTGVVSTGMRELRDAALLVHLMQATNRVEDLESIEALLSFLVGYSDNLTVSALRSAMESAGVTNARDLLDSTKMGAVQSALIDSGAGDQAIRSQVLLKPDGSTTPVRPPAVFQLFGQRFTIDSFALSQVVHDAIVFRGEPMRRMMPSGLDAMAALGNDLAVRLLEPELRQWNYAGNLAAIQELVRELPDQYWRDHVYGGWIHALRELDRDVTLDVSLPQVFRTEAWRRKQLQTQLASWSELRHDTILYAKQSYSGPSCEVPVAYVEPYPEFYAGLEQVARRAAEVLKPIPAPAPASRRGGGWMGAAQARQSYSAFFETMAGHLATLTELARKEIAQQPFTNDETLFLQKTISQKGNKLFGGSGFFEIQVYDGWYADLLYDFTTEEQKMWRATIADVHTDVQNKQVLEVGVGPVNYCVIVVDQDQGSKVFVGPAYSYYEFRQPISDRMTDEAWQAMLQHGDLPARPSFVMPIVGGASTQLTPVISVRRVGDQLEVTDSEQRELWGRPRVSLVPITREGFQRLASESPGVRHLDLSASRIVDADLSPLAPLGQIKAINLSGTSINGRGLAHLTTSRSLRQLVLSNTQIDDSSLSIIKDWIYLEKLDLSKTLVTDQGLTELAQSRYLRELKLEGTKVTEAGVKSLRTALPDCTILATVDAGGQRP